MLEKIKNLEILTKGGVIAVVRRIDPEIVESVTDALVSGGITALEITLDSENSFEIIKKLSKKYKDISLVGAGTVLDGHAAYEAVQNGAEFIFSPTLNLETIKTTLRYGKIVIPGVMTPTEAITAIEHGADMVKIFPANTLGASFFKDLKGPCPQIPMIPTGGVNLENAADFIKSGAEMIGIGGSLLDKKLIKEKDFEGLKKLAEAFVREVQEAKK
jgi:2-dehydro-3-deoxyphosphogluconate aldolase/(4S)-4-hydroxy-2-oxoglutarate aldolase